jgi:hypothetical protein
VARVGQAQLLASPVASVRPLHRPGRIGCTRFALPKPLFARSLSMTTRCAVTELAPAAERTAKRGKDRVVPDQLKPGDKLHGFTVSPAPHPAERCSYGQPPWARTVAARHQDEPQTVQGRAG